MKLSEVAQKLHCRLEGDGNVEITGVCGMEEARQGQISFLANRRYFPLLKTTQASAILIEDGPSLARDSALPPLAALRTANPYLAFAQAIDLFYQGPRYVPGIHPTAVIAKSAKIGENAHIGPYCFVDEDCVIGKNAVLHSFVTLYRGVEVGDNFFAHAHSVVREFCRAGNDVVLQNGAIIGCDGFGFAKQKDGSWYKITQSGPTILEDDVEVQANSCIDRATVGETRIRKGAKIDDLVLVGHASDIGQNSMLCGQVGIAGSTTIGKNCIMAGQSASSGHLTLGDNSVVTAQSGIPRDVEPGSVISGSPAVDNKLWLRTIAAMNHLPELLKRVRELESQVEKLKQA